MPGTRARATRLAQALLEGEADAVLRAIVKAAKSGDMAACRIIADRIVPPMRERPLPGVGLPTVERLEDLPAALARVVELVACGELGPSEGERVAELLSRWREAVETVSLTERVEALEAILRPPETV